MARTNSEWLSLFIKVGHIEGVSYLVLLGIAMPLKYFADIPEAVKITGYAHGFLFILYCVLLAMVMFKLKWSFFKGLLAFVLSLVPFGTFYLHKLK